MYRARTNNGYPMCDAQQCFPNGSRNEYSGVGTRFNGSQYEG